MGMYGTSAAADHVFSLDHSGLHRSHPPVPWQRHVSNRSTAADAADQLAGQCGPDSLSWVWRDGWTCVEDSQPHRWPVLPPTSQDMPERPGLRSSLHRTQQQLHSTAVPSAYYAPRCSLQQHSQAEWNSTPLLSALHPWRIVHPASRYPN